MAGADRFTITIRGKGGHGAYPEETKDALVIGSELVSTLPRIVSRNLSPLETGVLTIGKFAAGNAFNIIADEAHLEGTIRYLTPKAKETMKRSLYRITEGICSAKEATYSIEYEDGYPPLVNHQKETELIYQVAEEITEVNEDKKANIQIAAVDFANYLDRISSSFILIEYKNNLVETLHVHTISDIVLSID